MKMIYNTVWIREKRSCETQLLELVEGLCRKVSNCHQVDLVLLDFSNAIERNIVFSLILTSHL